jgi:glycosyltransferase involved in cell wall biosynthesis
VGGDERFICSRNDTNRGPAYSRNRCIGRAQGEFIAVQDADDVSATERLERQAGFLDSRPDVCAVGSFARLIDGDGTAWGRIEGPKGPGKRDWRKVPRSSTRRSCSGSPIWRCRPLRRGMRIAEDYDLFTRLVARGRTVVTVPEFLYAVRWDASSYGRKGFSSRWKRGAGEAQDRKETDE